MIERQSFGEWLTLESKKNWQNPSSVQQRKLFSNVPGTHLSLNKSPHEILLIFTWNFLLFFQCMWTTMHDLESIQFLARRTVCVCSGWSKRGTPRCADSLTCTWLWTTQRIHWSHALNCVHSMLSLRCYRHFITTYHTHSMRN
jgi:hypothetical protein